MKNLFKLSFLALAISLSVAACGDSAKTGTEGTDSTTVSDSSSMMSDSTMVDSVATDSAAIDTAAKM